MDTCVVQLPKFDSGNVMLWGEIAARGRSL
jgi:hypothetical protein